MRPPRKIMDIYCDLRSRLRKGSFKGRLPEERVLAAEYNAARNTLRAALDMLEKESLIVRERGRGTFPAEKVASNAKIVTMLVPTVDYITLHNYSYDLELFCRGARKQAESHGAQLEIVPVSLCNDRTRINYSFLEHLNSESMVIVDGIWYAPVFDFLRSRKCGVAYVTRNAYPRYRQNPELNRLPPEFYLLTEDISSGIENAMEYLAAFPCRKIAYMGPYSPSRKENFQGYVNGLRFFTNQSEHCFYNYEKLFPQTRKLSEFADIIRRWHQKEKFDGLIIRGGGKSTSFWVYNHIFDNADLGLPEEVKVVLGPFIYSSSEVETNLPFIFFDREKLGRLAVNTLLFPELSPRNRLITPNFKLPEEDI